MRDSAMWFYGRAAALVWVVMAASVAQAQSAPAMPDRFTATTASMTPADVALRIDVREWSDDEARAAVVAALGSGSEVRAALKDLPTIGYVWQSGSPVGYSLKYAHRTPTERGERVTFVTDRPLGSYERTPWAAAQAASQTPHDYSVIELYLNDHGSGDGTLSLAAAVELDEGSSLVTLAADAALRLLANAKLAPKAYGATGR